MAVRAEPAAHADAREALERAQEYLLGLQEEAGFWRAELETNPTMDAEDLLLREFLGIRDDGKLERAANWIRSQQRPDGSWSNFYGGPSNLSTNVECYAALRLAGDPVDAPHMLAADALKIMEDHRINALVVVDEEDRPIGAFNLSDLLRAGVM